MSRQAYPQYKPSDIEWLGQLPEHWEVKAAQANIQDFEWLDAQEQQSGILGW